MSDYIFSSKRKTVGALSNLIESIYSETPPLIEEMHGEWGSLAISHNQYLGFRPYETDQHIIAVIGGPVLCFRDNDFLVGQDSNIATKEIYQRWVVEKKIVWDEDLSGPFSVILVDKFLKNVEVVTDLMSFIPVYRYEHGSQYNLGTHVDCVAKISNETFENDEVSLADFILNSAITFPYTPYSNIFQLEPASEFTFGNSKQQNYYWLPKEVNPYGSISEAAKDLRDGISSYVERITFSMDTVAQFVSGGEDSRALCGLIPNRLKKVGYTFLDQMNREGEIAQKVANTYNIEMNIGYRKDTHYLDILEEATTLVGSGEQYFHAHSLNFDRTYNLSKYTAVFGGYLADSILKAPYARKIKGMNHFPFVPEIFIKNETRTHKIESNYISPSILDKVNQRRLCRYKKIDELRSKSAHEWFVLYPSTMRVAIGNFHSTRRLFRSYEPFMSNEVIKVGASVPTEWKLNRRLFNRAMKPFLKPSKWLLHGDGRLPYFPWWANSFIQVPFWFYHQIGKRIGLIKGNQDSWCSWKDVVNSSLWEELVTRYADSVTSPDFLQKDLSYLLRSSSLSDFEKVNLMQVLINRSAK